MTALSRTRIIGNKYNAILAAGIVASTQRASSELYLLSQQRTGNGRMVLGGPYTGAEDSVIDVEVLGGSAGALQASSVVVNGVGNGTLTVASIDVGAAAQTLSFTLLDSGTSPTSALLDFFGVQLAAKAIGTLGNAVGISVTRSLTFTDLPFATLEKLTAGSSLFDGAQYDWGQPAATGADIPEGALRIAFSGSPTVHRAWKKWESGRFVYNIDPPLPYDVLENSRIQEVTGDYTLTVEDGVDTEVYTAVTIYDFLTQVQARSALVQVLGVVAPDRAPGGQAVTDIPLRTDAHALPVIASTSRNGATMTVGTVDAGAATQNMTVTCLGRGGTGTSGGQTWSVSGGVVGALPAATTGVLYTDGPVQFTIGVPPVPAVLSANIAGRFLPTSREVGEGLPAICFKPLLLGAAANNKEVIFEYRQRPPDECSCSLAPALGVSMQCLGLTTEEGGTMDAAQQTRLIDLYEWHASFIGSNIALAGLNQVDVDLAGSCTAILAEALAEIYTVSAAATAWDTVFAELVAEMTPFLNMPTGSVAPGTAGAPLTAGASVGDFRYGDGTSVNLSGGVLDAVDGHAEVPGGVAAPSLAINFATLVAYFPQKYNAKMNWVRTLAGIDPKGSASSAGSTCWRDYGDSHWWEDTEGFYLPMFTNHPYVSAKREATGSIVSTQEFGLGLVTQCDHRIKIGDRIAIRISGTNGQNTWAEGDRFVIPLIGAANAPLTGGANGDPTQTWTARSSVLGALADYAYLPSAPAAWVHAPATVQLAPGGIPFEVGDTLSFNIEGGELRWRRDGGAWTTGDLYPASPLVLGDGLTLEAQAGAAPSFLAGDIWQFSAIAKYGTQRMRQPRIGQSFAWDGAACTLDIDLLTDTPLEAVLLAMHNVPLTATVTVHGGLLAANEWTIVAEVRKGIILAVLPHVEGDPIAEARYLQVVIAGAGAGGAVGWLWAGVGWQPTVGPSSMRLKRQYGLARGAGLNPSALYRGSGTGGSWVWALDSGAALLADEARSLMELVDHSAEQGLEPVALFPDILNAVDASVALIDSDEIEMEEFSNWQDYATHVVSLTLPLRAVLA